MSRTDLQGRWTDAIAFGVMTSASVRLVFFFLIVGRDGYSDSRSSYLSALWMHHPGDHGDAEEGSGDVLQSRHSRIGRRFLVLELAEMLHGENQ
jgi:hypothetical protein